MLLSTECFIWTWSLWNTHLSPKIYWLSMKITKEMWSTEEKEGVGGDRRNWSSLLSDQTYQSFHCTWFQWLRPSWKPCCCLGHWRHLQLLPALEICSSTVICHLFVASQVLFFMTKHEQLTWHFCRRKGWVIDRALGLSLVEAFSYFSSYAKLDFW